MASRAVYLDKRNLSEKELAELEQARLEYDREFWFRSQTGGILDGAVILHGVTLYALKSGSQKFIVRHHEQSRTTCYFFNDPFKAHAAAVRLGSDVHNHNNWDWEDADFSGQAGLVETVWPDKDDGDDDEAVDTRGGADDST